jgi:UDP-N-acetylglucosamine 3-dehydrogenase
MSLKGSAGGAKQQARGALRVGVIGAGIMGSNHARVLAGMPDVTLV